MNEPDPHRHFSSHFFNAVWDLLEKPERTPEEAEKMISLSHASLAHWRERTDCRPRNLSVGYWQLSRVYAVAGQPENAWRYGRLCLDISGGEPPFYNGYAQEALARAALLMGDQPAFETHLADARRLAAAVTDEGERALLENDLRQLAAAGSGV